MVLLNTLDNRKTYKIGCYTRISRDEDQKNYDTIISQRNIVSDYSVRDLNSPVFEYYEDDNVSGYSLDRPDFNRMLRDVDSGKINCIIAKDLSRIGRNNAAVLMFISDMKQKGVRVIGISDFDTDKDDGMLGIKTWVNERYVVDISNKIKENVKSKQQRGTYISAVPFGYKRDENNKSNIIIDEDAGWLVKIIFELYIGGNGYRLIANTLTNMKAPTPSMIVRKQKEQKGKIYKKDVTEEWSGTMVMRMIRNDFYTGTLRLGKNYLTDINGKVKKTDRDEHHVFENNHEALISKEDFLLAQEIAVKRNVSNYRGGGSKHVNLFSGFMKCVDCGSGMAALNKEGKNKSYICGTYNRRGKDGCTTHYIIDNKIKAGLRLHLQIVKEKLEDYLKNFDTVIFQKRNTKTKDTFEKRLIKLDKDQKNISEELKLVASQKIKDILRSPEQSDIISETYEQLENEKRNELTNLNNEILQLKKLMEEEGRVKENTVSAIELYDKLLNSEEFTKRDLEEIVDTMLISQGGDMQIILKQDVLKYIMS